MQGLKNGKGDKTFDVKFDRKVTVSRANVEKMIDDALQTGDFDQLDELYVGITMATCRHVGHSGPNRFPSKTDRCAVKNVYLTRKLPLKNYRNGNKEVKLVGNLKLLRELCIVVSGESPSP